VSENKRMSSQQISKSGWGIQLLKRKKIWFALFIAFLSIYGVKQYRLHILQPDTQWPEVSSEDLHSEFWYTTLQSKNITGELEKITKSHVMRFTTGFYYKEYKQRFSPGFKSTQYIRITQNQYPQILEMAANACQMLGKNDGSPIQLPNLYLGWTGKRELEVTNFTKPTIVIGNEYLWAFKPEELEFLIARQIGHIHCKHVYFLDVVKGVRALLDSALPDFIARAILGGLGSRLLDWNKEAQITADRAGLLATGDIDVACQALIKLNIQASLDDFYGQPNPEEYAKQTTDLLDDPITLASAALAEIRNPNPFLTIRVADLLRFYSANAALFKDRKNVNAGKSTYDAGVHHKEGTQN
jgi:hypothetical protein